ncbi:MAG: peptidoglycan-binding protein LysM [Ichthyobacteriaceae bacterium]|nr:peptidoglycan-binding protein LysM [Ichthyobacteriaceae bacterium]
MKIIFISSLFLFTFLLLGFTEINKELNNCDEYLVAETKIDIVELDARYKNMLVLIPKDEHLRKLTPMIDAKGFIRFKEEIGYRESSGEYDKVNTLGYLGKYQFGRLAMHDLAIHNKSKFLRTPSIQEDAFIALCSINKYKLRNYLRYEGRVIGGIKITESGMLAASHLLGPGAVMNYIKTSGLDKGSDAFGTSIVEYLVKFSGYDTSMIIPERQVTMNII